LRNVGDDDVARRVEHQVDVVPVLGRRRECLVEQVEESDAELDLLFTADGEVLEQRQVVIGPRWLAQVVGRSQLAILAERRYRDAIDVQKLLARILAAEGRIACVDRREAVTASAAAPLKLSRYGMPLASDVIPDSCQPFNRLRPNQLSIDPRAPSGMKAFQEMFRMCVRS
jgi:hypothetical protein